MIAVSPILGTPEISVEDDHFNIPVTMERGKQLTDASSTRGWQDQNQGLRVELFFLARLVTPPLLPKVVCLYHVCFFFQE